MSDDIRLQRIEEKLDKLADVVVGMARVEEKVMKGSIESLVK